MPFIREKASIKQTHKPNSGREHRVYSTGRLRPVFPEVSGGIATTGMTAGIQPMDLTVGPEV